MNWLGSAIAWIIGKLFGSSSEAHDNDLRKDGRNAEKVDEATKVNQEVLDAKTVDNVVDKSADGSALNELRGGWERPDETPYSG